MIELNTIQDNALKIYPTYQKFMEDQAPGRILINYAEIHEIKDAIVSRRLTIKEMDEIYHTSEFSPGVDYFGKWLQFFNKFSNINKPLPEDTVQWVAVHLYSKYCHFYFADLKVIFEQILESRYGKFYGSVDAVRIMSAFLEYNEDRNRIYNKEKERIDTEYQIWHKKRYDEIYGVVYDSEWKKYPDWTEGQKFDHIKKITEKKIKEETKDFYTKWQSK